MIQFQKLKSIRYNSNMRIAFFTDAFFPFITGVTTYVAGVTKALIADGHEVLIVAPRRDKGDLLQVMKFVPGAKVILVPGVRPFFYPDLKLGTMTPSSLNEVKKFLPEIIHFHTPGFMGFEATLLAKLLKIPLVTTFHTYYMEPEGFVAIGLKETGTVSKILQEALWKISEKVYQPCDAVIAPTNYVATDLKSRWRDINISVLPGSIDLEAFRNQKYRQSLRKLYKLKSEIVFLSVGRLSAEKHYDILITAFASVLKSQPESKLVFIGDGAAKVELKYISKLLGIEKSVIFIGEISYQKLTLKNYYAMGDVFITPSTWDTQGLSIIEAMAAKLPVIAFKYRAMPEVVGKGGLLVKNLNPQGLATAMEKLANNPKLRIKLGKLASLESNKYQIKAHVQGLLSLYKNLIKAKLK